MRSRRRRGLAAALATAVIATSAIVVPGAVFAATIVPVTNDATGATALANAMLANPGALTAASFAAHPPNGTPNGTSDALSFFPTNGGTFGILTTGDVNLADDANTVGNTGSSSAGTTFEVTRTWMSRS